MLRLTRTIIACTKGLQYAIVCYNLPNRARCPRVPGWRGGSDLPACWLHGSAAATRWQAACAVRQLAGSSLSDEDINSLVKRALAEAGAPHGLTLQKFKETLSAQELAGMVVEVPTEL